jgi:hypothetical protein
MKAYIQDLCGDEDTVVIDCAILQCMLQQDEWSLTKPKFGKEGQLTVVGWEGRSRGHKLYTLICNKCFTDTELFPTGYFKSLKSSLIIGQIPCGCSKKPHWSEAQYSILCKRKATELGFTFLGFSGEWNRCNTKIKMLCEKHGEWDTGTINNFMGKSHACPGCKTEALSFINTKPDDVMIASFYKSGAFHLETEFSRSDRVDVRGYNSYWTITCPECGEQGVGLSGDLQKGHRPCACNMHRQQECYINWLIDDHNMAVAIKFGIANNSKQRIKDQDRHSVYTLKQHSTYTFPDVASCKKAERECKKELETGVVLKRDMPDGYSETTWAYNIGRVKTIYERNGGVLVE